MTRLPLLAVSVAAMVCSQGMLKGTHPEWEHFIGKGMFAKNQEIRDDDRL